MPVNKDHLEEAMRDCLERSKEFRGTVGTGAMVAAAVLRGRDIVARGVHRAFGTAHGERDLFNRFGEPIEPDDILVVNLEPCCPSPTKKTPPCTEIILGRDVRRIAIGMGDPDERVAGKGLEILRGRGVEIIGPVLEPLSQAHNRGFTTLRTQGRPWTSIAHDPDDIGDGDYAQHAAVVTDDIEFLVDSLDRNKNGGGPLHILASRGFDDTPEEAGVRIFRIEEETRDAALQTVIKRLVTPNGDFHGITNMILSGELAEEAVRMNKFDQILDAR